MTQSLAVAFSALAAAMAATGSFFSILLRRRQMKAEAETDNIREEQRRILSEMEEFGRRFSQHGAALIPQFGYMSRGPDDGDMVNTSLFDARRAHFSQEKEILAERVVEKVASLIDPDLSSSRKAKKLGVILFLDSGSTVFPVFKKLCLHPSFRSERANAQRLKLVTNNLPGVADLLRYGKTGRRRQARTIFDCRILSGFANSAYGASLNDGTAVDLETAIEEARASLAMNHVGDVEVIAVTTGNYVSVPDGVLARDPNHVRTKSTSLEHCGKAYVLAPLGKLMPFSCAELNRRLELRDGSEQYQKLGAWTTHKQKLTVLVTVRPPGYPCGIEPASLSTHLVRVQAEIREAFGKEQIEEILFDPHDDPTVRFQIAVMGAPRTLREYEFPHRDLRERLCNEVPYGAEPV
ncbi:MAG: hypothetical protein WBC63_07710 [Candidatus Bipolaricaulia bacterium]